MANKSSDEKISVIVGSGKTGLSCARFLQDRGLPFMVVDSRIDPPGMQQLVEEFPEVQLELGGFRSSTFNNARQLIVSPGVSLRETAIVEARSRGVLVTGDIDLFSQYATAPVVAVTGSNGKSTVVSLVAEILSAAGQKVGLGGNLDGANARPALELLLRKQTRWDVFVLELSSFQLETTSDLRAEVAVILNLSEDHMDRYDDIDGYWQAKQRIFRGARKIVVNRDNPFSEPPDPGSAQILRFGVGEAVDGEFGLSELNGTQHLCFGDTAVTRVDELKVAGRHNVANVLAAMTICHALGVDLKTIGAAVREFRGLPNRCQWVTRVDDVNYYNDSKGTNVGATVAAIDGVGQAISGRVVLIAGGVGKSADFTPLRPVVERYVRLVIVIGAAARELAETLKAQTGIQFAGDMDEAVRLARKESLPGDAVLLSPACASFDMFRDFNHRGQVFTEAVRSLQ
ncbi:MAG: UDP-N-acetylmuramoyl-L-alanine--D-glutamate ligase [Gammaproteobacteria bacterium]